MWEKVILLKDKDGELMNQFCDSLTVTAILFTNKNNNNNP